MRGFRGPIAISGSGSRGLVPNPFDERQLYWFTCEASDGSSFFLYIKPVVERKDRFWLHSVVAIPGLNPANLLY